MMGDPEVTAAARTIALEWGRRFAGLAIVVVFLGATFAASPSRSPQREQFAADATFGSDPAPISSDQEPSEPAPVVTTTTAPASPPAPPALDLPAPTTTTTTSLPPTSTTTTAPPPTTSPPPPTTTTTTPPEECESILGVDLLGDDCE